MLFCAVAMNCYTFAMSCYDFAMFRKAGGQREGTGHGRARRRLAIKRIDNAQSVIILFRTEIFRIDGIAS